MAKILLRYRGDFVGDIESFFHEHVMRHINQSMNYTLLCAGGAFYLDELVCKTLDGKIKYWESLSIGEKTVLSAFYYPNLVFDGSRLFDSVNDALRLPEASFINIEPKNISGFVLYEDKRNVICMDYLHEKELRDELAHCDGEYINVFRKYLAPWYYDPDIEYTGNKHKSDHTLIE